MEIKHLVIFVLALKEFFVLKKVRIATITVQRLNNDYVEKIVELFS